MLCFVSECVLARETCTSSDVGPPNIPSMEPLITSVVLPTVKTVDMLVESVYVGWLIALSSKI